MYTFETIREKLKNVLAKEGMDAEKMRYTLGIFKKVVDSLLEEDAPLPKDGNPPNDLDNIILNTIRETKADKKFGTRLPITWFIENNFSEILDVKNDYYILRAELLNHSKILTPIEDNMDYLSLLNESV
jgi:hypothetical protein